MTSTGTKVETIEKLGEDIENVVAGKIDSVTPHPDSDHLVICMVDVGGEKPLQIVTGAQNVHAGDFVPVCLNGAKLPGGKVIKSGKLRGVISEGFSARWPSLDLRYTISLMQSKTAFSSCGSPASPVTTSATCSASATRS